MSKESPFIWRGKPSEASKSRPRAPQRPDLSKEQPAERYQSYVDQVLKTRHSGIYSKARQKGQE